MPHLQSVYFDFSKILKSEDYIKSIPALENLEVLEFHNKLTYFVWENGSGKSTLMEAIATNFGFNKEWGNMNTQYSTNTTDNIESNWLGFSWKPNKYTSWFFFRAEGIYNFNNYLEDLSKQPYCGDAFSPYGWKNLHHFSHGQQFLKIVESFQNRVWLYIFDEIESALSPINQLKLVEIIKYMIQQGSQFIIATHSPILLSITDSCIYNFDEAIEQISYDNVSCVDIYKRVLQKKI